MMTWVCSTTIEGMMSCVMQVLETRRFSEGLHLLGQLVVLLSTGVLHLGDVY